MRELIPCLIVSFLCVGLSAAAAAEPLKVVMLSGSAEYKSDESLPLFKDYLESRYNARCTVLKAEGEGSLPGLEALDACDVALFFTRRLTIDGEPLERVKRYCLGGKPLVACRTASHGFQKWLDLDKLVLGGNYTGHYGQGLTAKAEITPDGAKHPILQGLRSFKSRYSLYKAAPVAKDATILMMGSTPESKAPEPLAWAREVRGGRVFYTSLGGPEDFENATFRRMMANALFWAARREVEAKPLPPVRERPKPQGTLSLRLRTRVETAPGSREWEEKLVDRQVPVAETAILICDMWDKHWCDGATQRVGEIVKKMGPLVDAARARGVQIIHCPSETLEFYFDWPQRRRMQQAPQADIPTLADHPDPPLPIDARDGGCDTGQKSYSAWTRQHPGITIGELDGISDNGDEVYRFLRQQGITTLLVMGVHTNMCVLHRSFGIKRMTRLGIGCVLVRDLTDTMYNPASPPHVSHDEGTRLVVEFIEKYWCPITTSEEVLKGLP